MKSHRNMLLLWQGGPFRVILYLPFERVLFYRLNRVATIWNFHPFSLFLEDGSTEVASSGWLNLWTLHKYRATLKRPVFINHFENGSHPVKSLQMRFHQASKLMEKFSSAHLIYSLGGKLVLQSTTLTKQTKHFPWSPRYSPSFHIKTQFPHQPLYLVIVGHHQRVGLCDGKFKGMYVCMYVCIEPTYHSRI